MQFQERKRTAHRGHAKEAVNPISVVDDAFVEIEQALDALRDGWRNAEEMA